MSLFNLAQQVNPHIIRDHEAKVIWSSKATGEFVYLFREDNAIMLRLSGSEFQLAFYKWSNHGWDTATQEDYKRMVELWQDEKKDRL